MSSARGYLHGCKIFSGIWSQMFGVSCRVNIYRVNRFRAVSCQNSACQRVHAISWSSCVIFVWEFACLALVSCVRNGYILQWLTQKGRGWVISASKQTIQNYNWFLFVLRISLPSVVMEMSLAAVPKNVPFLRTKKQSQIMDSRGFVLSPRRYW